jgi:hypothetical protein
MHEHAGNSLKLRLHVPGYFVSLENYCIRGLFLSQEVGLGDVSPEGMMRSWLVLVLVGSLELYVQLPL